MNPARPVWPALLALLLLALPAAADDRFALKGGERVVFFGDSITQAGQYVAYVDAFLLTRFPDRTFTVINHGISSETISGTSEPDHVPRRPDAHDRFARDVAAWKPDVVVACFGMNDGNYFPFDEGRYRAYRDGVRRLIDRTREEAHARLVLLTPPPFDPYMRRVGDAEAVHYGYKFPAIDYDRTLARYADFLLTLRDEGFTVADVHSATNEHLAARRREKVSFFLAGDAVHPNPTGHWLMAQTLLLAWGSPAEVAEACVDAANLKAVAGEVGDLARDGEAVAFTWRSPLPLPIDPAWDAESIRLERVDDRLNRYRLAVRGLPAARYRLIARDGDGPEVEVATLGRERLAEGVDLAAYEAFPTVAAARAVLKDLLAYHQDVYRRWRQQIARPATEPAGERPGDGPPPEAIRRACRPRDLRIRLEPVAAH